MAEGEGDKQGDDDGGLPGDDASATSPPPRPPPPAAAPATDPPPPLPDEPKPKPKAELSPGDVRRSELLKNAFGVAYALCIGSALVAWLVIGYRVVFANGSRIEAINEVGLTITILCLVIWLGDVLNFQKLSRTLAISIYTAFISSVLVTSASVIKATFLVGPNIHIEDAPLLNEKKVVWERSEEVGEPGTAASEPTSGASAASVTGARRGFDPKLTDIDPKGNTFYAFSSPDKVFIPFALVVTGATPSADGQYLILGTATVRNQMTRLSDTDGAIPPATSDKPWAKRPLTQRLVKSGALPDKLAAINGAGEGKIVLINSIRDLEPGLWNSPDGKLVKETELLITFTVVDGVNHTQHEVQRKINVKFE
jgi:hypothetical protein